jgi:hypothetical protein
VGDSPGTSAPGGSFKREKNPNLFVSRQLIGTFMDAAGDGSQIENAGTDKPGANSLFAVEAEVALHIEHEH